MPRKGDAQMTRANLYFIIAALIVVYAMTLVAAYIIPAAVMTLKELAALVMGGLLAIMRPSSQQVKQ